MNVNNWPVIRYFREQDAARKEAKRARLALARFSQIFIGETAIDLARIGEFRNEAFPQCGPYTWLDRADALLEIDRRLEQGKITQAQADICAKWAIDGYCIIEGLVSREQIERVWGAYEKAIEDGIIELPAESVGPDDRFPGRRLDPHLLVPEIKELQHDPKILEITDLLFGRKTLPFQTIMGHKGSNQRAHSDHIHMTTYPLGWMLANWIALEDVHPDSGPLEYYPRSHRLVPALFSEDIGIPPFEFKKTSGSVYSERYEPVIQSYIDRTQLKPEPFLARAGDVLFWHANLLHGGSRRKDLAHSRKALVCHYFAEGAVTYHDLSGNPSRLHSHGWLEPARSD